MLGFAAAADAQQAAAAARFEVASVKHNLLTTGGDGEVTIEPTRFAARNTTLKRLLFEAWQTPYAQISARHSGMAWIGADEYDVEARASVATPPAQLRLMLRNLLTERFQLEVRTGEREQRVYVLTVDKGGAHLTTARSGRSIERFHGDLSEFANVLAVKLTIPVPNAGTPGVPSRASGPAIPVLNKTGIDGVHDLAVDLQLDQSGDTFTLWQRALREQLGLRLESQRAPAPFLTVVHAERIPAQN
ncbi:MAG TPA: TIGR03435 family protein [Bryobacteraceae bacterium]|jgi:uncharacterized protein (TIGR03435 family)|nr:TIGR03435 family protein [Bryobacteraceae bacterium]